MKRSFTIIFIINMVLRIIMQGLLPLYPVITERVGATKQQNGVILAGSFTMLLVSTILSGKLVPKYTSAKNLLLFSALPMCASMAMIGYATTISHFVIYSLVLFFFAGINTIAGIMLISAFSSSKSAGENFGIIGLSNLLGSLLGGFIVGPVLYRYGYVTGFIMFAIGLLISCIFTFWVDQPIMHKQQIPQKLIMTRRFSLLLLSFVLALMLIHVFLFSFSLTMKAHGYNISQISLYSAIGTGVILPVPYLLGRWTRKYKPRNLLVLTYISMAVALLLLQLNQTPAIILTAVALMCAFAFGSRAVIIAMVFPWFTEQEMPMAQAYMGAAAWLGAIIGYLFSGFSLTQFGLHTTLWIGVFIAFVAIIILSRVDQDEQAANAGSAKF